MSGLKLSRIDRGMRIYREATQEYFESGNGTISLRSRNNLKSMGGLEIWGYAFATMLHPIQSYKALRGTQSRQESVLEEWWEE